MDGDNKYNKHSIICTYIYIHLNAFIINFLKKYSKLQVYNDVQISIESKTLGHVFTQVHNNHYNSINSQ